MTLLLMVTLVAASGLLLLGRGALADLRLPGSSAVVPAPSSDDRLAEALAALRRWDALRATAYAAGDAGRLRSLYAEGSSAASADVRILRSYTARGLVVDRMRSQVLGVEPVSLGKREVTLRVRDRLVGAEAVDIEGRRLVLPRDGVTTRVLTLARSGEGWLMSEVLPE